MSWFVGGVFILHSGFVEVVMRRCGLISPSHSRRYLPVLRDFPAKFIYDPWNAPEDVQSAAGCVIGVDYPKPMVNHAEASRLNIERMRQIYQQLSRYRGLSKTRFTSLNENVLSSLVWSCLLVCLKVSSPPCRPITRRSPAWVKEEVWRLLLSRGPGAQLCLTVSLQTSGRVSVVNERVVTSPCVLQGSEERNGASNREPNTGDIDTFSVRPQTSPLTCSLISFSPVYLNSFLLFSCRSPHVTLRHSQGFERPRPRGRPRPWDRPHPHNRSHPRVRHPTSTRYETGGVFNITSEWCFHILLLFCVPSGRLPVGGGAGKREAERDSGPSSSTLTSWWWGLSCITAALCVKYNPRMHCKQTDCENKKCACVCFRCGMKRRAWPCRLKLHPLNHLC